MGISKGGEIGLITQSRKGAKMLLCAAGDFIHISVPAKGIRRLADGFAVYGTSLRLCGFA
jgi:hypothetical protein